MLSHTQKVEKERRGDGERRRWEKGEDEKSGREGEKKKPEGNDSHNTNQKSLKKRREAAPPFLSRDHVKVHERSILLHSTFFPRPRPACPDTMQRFLILTTLFHVHAQRAVISPLNWFGAAAKTPSSDQIFAHVNALYFHFYFSAVISFLFYEL